MTILYSCIARPDEILCSEASEGNSVVTYENPLRSILPKLKIADARTSFEKNGYMYHILLKNVLIYVAVSDPSFGKSTPHEFLKKIEEAFNKTSLPERAASASEHEFNMDFRTVLSDEMRRASSGAYGRISALSGQVNEVREVMTKNIDSVLKRGENLENLNDRTAALEETSRQFHSTSKQVSRKYWWKNMKMKIIIAVIVITIIAIIIIVIVAETGGFKKKSGNSQKSTTTAANTG